VEDDRVDVAGLSFEVALEQIEVPGRLKLVAY
jgi:hypothetical protein